MTCTHRYIQTWTSEDGIARMWGCAECRRKFVPLEIQKPLTSELIDDIANKHSDELGMIAADSWEDFARDLEAALGIKP